MSSASRTRSRILQPFPTSSYRTSGHVPDWVDLRSARIGYFLLSRSVLPLPPIMSCARPGLWTPGMETTVEGDDPLVRLRVLGYTAPHSLPPSSLDLPFQRWHGLRSAQLVRDNYYYQDQVA
ncbi:hypothetical protein MY3296_009386 [Beauveria thailandica]